MTGFGDRVSAQVDVPVVDGVVVAVQLAEMFVRLGYSPRRLEPNAKDQSAMWPCPPRPAPLEPSPARTAHDNRKKVGGE